MTNGNIAYAKQFFHFTVILINTSQLFITEHPALKCAGYSITSCLGLLTISHPRSSKKIIFLAMENEQRISFGSQNYMGACSQAPRAAPGQRQM